MRTPAERVWGNSALEARISLASHLLGQLNVMRLSQRDRLLASAVVESLDDDGYLRMPLTEVADALSLLPAAQPEELSIALRRVQALDPAGVAARNVAECLGLQVPGIADAEVRVLAGTIVREHLDLLAARDMRALARRVGRDPASVEAACAAIRRLDPHPGWRYSEGFVQYVTPDVIVKKIRGQWKPMLNEAVVPRVRLNRAYVDLFQQYRGAQHSELGAHLQEARWTVRNVEQRFSTILSVAQAILKRQQHFLASGHGGGPRPAAIGCRDRPATREPGAERGAAHRHQVPPITPYPASGAPSRQRSRNFVGTIEFCSALE